MSKLTIVSAQSNYHVGAIEKNADLIIKASQEAAEKYQADLVVFPELTITGYPAEDLLFRADLYRRCEAALKRIAKATTETSILIGYPALEDGLRYNRAAFIEKGVLKATYDKQDLPNYTVFDEKRYFTAGDKPCIISVNDFNIGVIICEDLWNNGPAEQAAAAGAELIVSLNASPYDRNKVRQREDLLIKRSVENNVGIVYVNNVGGQDELVFDGGSMVVNAEGERCCQSLYYQEDLMPIHLSKENGKIDIEKKELPPRLSAEENIYNTLVAGVHDYIEKNNFPGAILGLSGGIDSALVLAIAVDAIGADRVTAVMMPSRYTAKISIEDAIEEAKTLGVKYESISIEAINDQFTEALHPLFKDTQPCQTEENLQARIRGTLLMALSNKFGGIVLTTGNKSEMSVGYATLYGDMAGGFAALKDIPKTLVYRLADYRNRISPVIPERVIERAPSAELSENQTDQDTLPPYEVLDDIIDRYIEKEQSIDEISKVGYNREVVANVVKMINRSEYKRSQAPVGIRTSQRAFGKDRRYPITSGY